jgi:hypothetical protein
MKTQLFARFALILSVATAALAQIPTPELNAIFTKAATALSTLNFDAKSPVSIRSRIATLVFPESSAGMVVVNSGTDSYAFTTAGVPALAKQGFTRFTAKPGQEVIVTGVLAEGRVKIGPGAIAARADVINKIDGSELFNRANLAQR